MSVQSGASGYTYRNAIPIGTYPMQVSAVSGLAYLIQGVGLIARPGLRRFVVIPLLVNVLVFSCAIYAGFSWFHGILAWVEARVPRWFQWLEWLLWPVFVLTLLVLVFYTFGLVANADCCPVQCLIGGEGGITPDRPAAGCRWRIDEGPARVGPDVDR